MERGANPTPGWHNHAMMHTRTLALLVLSMLSTGSSPASAGVSHEDGTWVFEHPDLTVRLTPRSPDQMAAFYEARGFPQAMLALTRAACFITVLIRNTSDHIVWLDLDRWHFDAGGEPVERLDRAWWQNRWETLPAPPSNRSTFRWTLLPERLDYRPGEREGGNITLPRSDRPLRVEAHFATGSDGGGETISMVVQDLRCPEDSNP